MSGEQITSSREIKLNTHTSRLKEARPSLHLLPCKVECGDRDEDGCGPAKVASYFAPVIMESNENIRLSTNESKDELTPVYTATFRGRRLKGVKVTVPSGFVGCVLKEGTSCHDGEAREFKVQTEFKEFSYWNLQNTPTADDKLFQALTWSRVAQNLHSPLPVQDPEPATVPMDSC